MMSPAGVPIGHGGHLGRHQAGGTPATNPDGPQHDQQSRLVRDGNCPAV